MKKSITILIVLFAIAVAIGSMLIVSSNLYATDCRCYIDNSIMWNCALYCSRMQSSCTYFAVLKATCKGNRCNQLWEIGCENKETADAGGDKMCEECVATGDFNPGDDPDPAGTGHTPLDASGKPMF